MQAWTAGELVRFLRWAETRDPDLAMGWRLLAATGMRRGEDAVMAEDYAAWSIDFAYSALLEAEYASLDAVLARMDADAAAQSTVDA
jgi:hypothetical protein